MNEELENLGNSAFRCCDIESIRLPLTLRSIGDAALEYCRNLKYVKIPRGVEYIGNACFRLGGLEEITLPSTLKRMGAYVFSDSFYLRTVWVEEGCALDVRKYVKNFVEVRHK